MGEWEGRPYELEQTLGTNTIIKSQLVGITSNKAEVISSNYSISLMWTMGEWEGCPYELEQT